jgi:hypothetical protein
MGKMTEFLYEKHEENKLVKDLDIDERTILQEIGDGMWTALIWLCIRSNYMLF